MSNRISTSNTEDFLKGKMLDNAINKKEDYTRIFYPGIVINNVDPKNANRIQVRIPFVDDNAYVNRTKSDGDLVLPWCSPFSRNFIGTPENNTIVMVALFDPRTPYWGRMYFDSITDLNDTALFDPSRLVPEATTYNNWNNTEKTYNILLKSRPPQDNSYNSNVSVKYLMGLRGKGKNRITLDDNSIQIIQNEGNAATQSLLKLTQNISMVAADQMELLSTKGNSTHYHPVFDQPLYDYLAAQNSMMKAIVTVLNSVPSLAYNMKPNVPSPNAINLITNLTDMYARFNKLKVPGVGASKQISIN